MRKIKRVLLFLPAATLLATILICLMIYPSFDWKREAISFFGMISPTENIFALGLISSGMFNLISAFIAVVSLRIKTTIALLLLLSGIGMMLCGMIPYVASAIPDFHTIFAIMFTFSFGTALILLGFVKSNLSKGLMRESLFLGIIYFSGAFIVKLFVQGLALSELWGLFVYFVWLVRISPYTNQSAL